MGRAGGCVARGFRVWQSDREDFGEARSGLAAAEVVRAGERGRESCGSDEVHKILIAKNLLRRYHAGGNWDFGN